MTFSAAATLLIAAGLIIFWPGRNAAPGHVTAVAQQPAADPFGAPRADNNNADPFSKSNPDPFAPGRAPNNQDDPFAPDPPKNPRPMAASNIELELAKPTTVDFVEQPLRDCMQYLGDLHKIPIYIRKKKLDEASVPLDKPVTISLRGVPLRTTLDLMLDELELTYFIKDVLIITTPEDAESNLETRVYDCRDLLAMPAPEVPQPPKPRGTTIPPPPITAPGSRITPVEPAAPGGAPSEGSGLGTSSGGEINRRGANAGGMIGDDSIPRRAQKPQTELEKRTEQLTDLITGTVAPQSWDDVGGPGAIDAYNGLFVVSQTAKVHEQVEHVLDMLRKAASLEAPKGAKVVR